MAGAEGRGNVVVFGFPFETITTSVDRAAVIDRVLGFFNVAVLPPPSADFNSDGIVDAADYVVWRKNEGNSVPAGTLGDADGNGDEGFLEEAPFDPVRQQADQKNDGSDDREGDVQLFHGYLTIASLPNRDSRRKVDTQVIS